MDGTGPSAMTLDHDTGNVYKIQYQWLGFGPIQFFIEKPNAKDKFQLVHEVEYINTNTVSSVVNPTLPMYILSKNAANTSDIVVKVGSHSAESEGTISNLGVPKSTSVNDKSGYNQTVSLEILLTTILPPGKAEEILISFCPVT